MVPSTWYQVLGAKYVVPSTWYQVLGTKYASIANDLDYIWDLWASCSRNQALGSPCGTPDGRLGLPRHPEPSLGRGGGGVAGDFQRIVGSPKTNVWHFPVNKCDLLRDILFSDVSRRNPVVSGGRPLQSAVYSSKNQLFRFWLRMPFLVHMRPQDGPVLGPKVTTILFWGIPLFGYFLGTRPGPVKHPWRSGD